MRAARLFLLITAAALLLPGAAAAGPGRQTFRIPMSDGAKLATDVFLPEGDGPFPAILSRTPYGRGRGVPRSWLDRGVAVVRQDMRGRFDSEGENLPFVGCGWVGHRDGAETVAWIRAQKWSDGRVATLGGSAGGITQNLLAGAAPEGLACQYINVAAASLYHHATYVGGAFRKSQVELWLLGNRFDPKALRTFKAHPAYDDFWRGYDSTTKHAVMKVPAVHVGGWFDTFALGTVESFTGRQREGGGQRMVMGPWGHGGYRNGGRIGDLTFANSRMPPGYSAAEWFAWRLLGEKNAAVDRPAVAYYVMGDAEDPKAPGNEWRFADAWPVPAKETSFHLRSDGRLTRDAPVKDTGYVGYTFDPADPCPTAGGCNLVLAKGPKDQREVEARADVVTFTTAPLEKPVEVTGHPRAVIFVTSSAKDTDLSVRFSDVYPDGRSMLMAEGMLRLRFREGFEKAVPLVPGEVYEITVPLWPTSVVVNRGHRIRLAVTSSNHPRFDLNPGTGRPERKGGRTVRQRNRIWCDASRPSRIVLPLVGVE